SSPQSSVQAGTSVPQKDPAAKTDPQAPTVASTTAQSAATQLPTASLPTTPITTTGIPIPQTQGPQTPLPGAPLPSQTQVTPSTQPPATTGSTERVDAIDKIGEKKAEPSEQPKQ